IYLLAADAWVSTGWRASGAWTVPNAATSLVVSGDQGDWISGGQGRLFTSEDGFFSASANYDNGVSLAFHTPSWDHWWYLDFAAANNQLLTVRPFTGAARFPFQASGQPGLS